MNNYINMLLNRAGDLQSDLSQFTTDFHQRRHGIMQGDENPIGNRLSAGTFITYNRLDARDDPAKAQRLLALYRHLAKLKFDACVKLLPKVYEDDISDMLPSFVSVESLVVDTFSNHCLNLAIGELAKHAMTQEVFLKLYGEGGEDQVNFIDQPHVAMDFFVSGRNRYLCKGAPPYVTVFVRVGKWVNTHSTSAELFYDAIDSRCFYSGIELNLPPG